MDQTIRHSIGTRQYRAATFLVAMGALSIGVLLLSRFTEAYFASINFYYGRDTAPFPQLHELSGFSLTVGQLVVACIALGGVVTFVASERRRLNRLAQHHNACVRSQYATGVERLSREQRLATWLKRTGLFAGLLLVSWLGQTAYEAYVGGYGVAPMDYYYSPMAFMPLFTIFLTCLLLGGGVAMISMFGLRAIVALQGVLCRARGRARVRRTLPRPGAEPRVRSLRELFGYEILSRPPPAALATA